MSSLAGTSWVIHHPHPNGISFAKQGGTCTYGPYNGTFTEPSPGQFVVRIPTPEGAPLCAQIQFAGTHQGGAGSGIQTHIPSPGFNPDGIEIPFTMTVVQRVATG